MVSLYRDDILLQHPSDEDMVPMHSAGGTLRVVIIFNRADFVDEEIAQHEMLFDRLRCRRDVRACSVDLSEGWKIFRARGEHDEFEDFVDAEDCLLRIRCVCILNASCFDDVVFGHDCGGANGLVRGEAGFGDCSVLVEGRKGGVEVKETKERDSERN